MASCVLEEQEGKILALDAAGLGGGCGGDEIAGIEGLPFQALGLIRDLVGIGRGTRVGGSSCLAGFSPGRTGSSGPGLGAGLGFMPLLLHVPCQMAPIHGLPAVASRRPTAQQSDGAGGAHGRGGRLVRSGGSRGGTGRHGEGGQEEREKPANTHRLAGYQPAAFSTVNRRP